MREARAREEMLAQALATLKTRETSLAEVLAQLDTEKTAGTEMADRVAALEAQLAEGADAAERIAALETQLSEEEKARLAEAAAAEALRARFADLETALSEEGAARLAEAATAAALQARIDELEAVAATLTDAEQQRLAEAAAAEALRQRLAEAKTALSEEEQARIAEAAAAEALRARLENADTELTAMTLALEEARKQAEDTLTLLAAAEAAKADLDEKLAAALLENETLRETTGNEAELRERLAAALAAKLAAETDAAAAMTEAERQAALLATAAGALENEKQASTEAQRQMALLNEQMTALRTQLAQLRALLDDYESRDEAAQVQIERLGSDLNAALARVAAEERKRAELEAAERKRAEEEAARLAEEARLAQAEVKDLATYRSEFFGRMRQILGDREGVQIVGDRFVFSSEVLFPPGSADLSEGGKAQIARVAGILSEVSGEIPPEIDWVIRVDGHTDKTGVGAGSDYADNWELSQARALSVVHYMTRDLGFPPERLAATGFGEFQPVAPGNTPADYAANRRIELKLTEK